MIIKCPLCKMLLKIHINKMNSEKKINKGRKMNVKCCVGAKCLQVEDIEVH